jgi:beta-glucosidase
MSTARLDVRAGEVLGRMTVDEKIAMVHGTASSAYTGYIPGDARLCIPALKLQDGPLGVRMSGTTQLPSAAGLAASFDPQLAGQYGAVIGAEDKAKGVDVDLGPTVNIVRDPRWGRAFESYSEDPYLTGQIGAADISGIQSQGVMAQVKHWAVYNQETNRNGPADNAVVDDRTVHEIYTAAFGAIIAQSHPASVMCSYSTINSTYACENGYLNEILKTEFGFDGFIGSDWGATHSTVASANAGMDLEMPDASHFGAALKQAVQTGRVPQSRLDDMVRRILAEEFRFGLFDHPSPNTPNALASTAAHVAVARTVAQDGAVLLKNADAILPIDTSAVHSIAVIGEGAGQHTMSAGGGSAVVPGTGTVTPFNGIKARAGSRITVNYASGASSVLTAQAAELARRSDLAIVYATDFESEERDLTNIDLPAAQNALIDAVAAANPNTIVVLNTGSAVTMPWADKVKGILEAWYPGQESGSAIAALLFGDVNPSGKLPVTFPTSLRQVPASRTAEWPGANGTVQYAEGLQVGYRWYDAQHLTPLYPFGYGLSYTTFAFSQLTVSTPLLAPGRSIQVSADITNTGHRAGADVAQLYLAYPASTGEPPSQLRGFQKIYLQPGQTRHVQFTLTARDASYWQSKTHAWTLAPGTYMLRVGDSSRSLPLAGSFNVAHS